MLEKENQECHCTENCACKNQSEEHNKTATSCGCDSQSVLDKIMEYEDSCNCGCESDCTDESCNCCEEESCGCEEHSCGCGEHHEHK